MQLDASTIDGLVTKFTDEIEEVREAIQEESDAAVKRELHEALGQSETLLLELKELRLVFREVESEQRPFDADEIAAFRYFGFDVPDDGNVFGVVETAPQQQRVASTELRRPVSPPDHEPQRHSHDHRPQAVTPEHATGFQLPRRSVDPEAPDERRADPTRGYGSTTNHTESETDPSTMQGGPTGAHYRPLTPERDVTPRSMSAAQPAAPAPISPPLGSSPVPVAAPVHPHRHSLDSPAGVPPTGEGLYAQTQRGSVHAAPPSVPQDHTASPEPHHGRGARYTEADVQERALVLARRMAEDERAHLRREFAQQANDNAVSAAQQVDAERRKWERTVSQLSEDNERRLRETRRRLEDELEASRDAVIRGEDREREATYELQHLRAEHARLRVELQASGAEAQSARNDRDRAETLLRDVEDRHARDTAAATRAEWLSVVGTVLRDNAEGTRRAASLEADLAQLRDTQATDIRELQARKHQDDVEARALTASAADVVQQAQAALEESVAVAGLPVVYRVSSGDADELDRAVERELTDLRLPVAVALRRIGPHGEYYLDRPITLKVVHGHVMAKRAGSQSATYEPLAKYVARVYAPLLDRDVSAAVGLGTDEPGRASMARHESHYSSTRSPQPDAATSSPNKAYRAPSGSVSPPHHPQQPAGMPNTPSPRRFETLDTTAPPPLAHHEDPMTRIHALQQEQQRLAAQLQEEHRRAAADSRLVSSSPPERYGSSPPPHATARLPREASNAPDALTRAQPTPTARRTPSSMNDRLRQSQQKMLNSSGYAGTSTAAGRTLQQLPAAGGYSAAVSQKPSSLRAAVSTMSDDEIELLKRLALAKQVRDARRQQQTGRGTRR